MQILTRPAFDVCVIGSGPAGGFAAKELTEAGATVVLLEAGDEVPPHQFAGHAGRTSFRGAGASRNGSSSSIPTTSAATSV